jgi:hypothetical protein
VGEPGGRTVTVGVQELPFDALVRPVFEDLEVDGDVVSLVEVWVVQAILQRKTRATMLRGMFL